MIPNVHRLLLKCILSCYYHVYDLRYTLFLIYFQLVAATFDLRNAQTWNRIPSSLSVLSDPENMGLAVTISLLSFILAEIYVISYLLPVNGRHLWFTTCPGTEQHRYVLLCMLWYWKRVIAVEIVLLSRILAEIRVITLAVILDCWLPVSSESVINSSIEKFDRENMGVAVGILFLASLEAEIPLGVVLPSPFIQTSLK